MSTEPKKLSGKQISAFRVQAFKDWEASMSNQDYRSIMHGGQLKREDIKTQCNELLSECEFSLQCLTKNRKIEKLLEDLENKLRKDNILPLKTEKGKTKQKEQSSSKGAISVSEAAKLHQRILELESENEALKGNYGRFSEVAEVYHRLGQMKK